MDHLSLLLQTKAGIEPVTDELTAAAEKLRQLGLIMYERRAYVRCAFTEDRDFPRSNRTCCGRLFLTGCLDENNRDFRCPDCGRDVYPARDGKRQFQELRVKVLDDGIGKYVSHILAKRNFASDPMDGVPFAWRINLGVAGVYLCIADYCDHQQLTSIQWAQQNPTCYVFVNPRAIERFAAIDWICKAFLADIVSGRLDLGETIKSLAASRKPRDLPALATPAYSKAAHRPEPVVVPYETVVGLFVVEIGAKTASINGIEVLAAQARTAHQILRQLAKAFTEDVLAGRPPNEYCCQTPGDIADVLQKSGNKSDAVDQDQVRRTINRLQDSIEQRLREAGIATERDSVIQASPNTSKEGYRLNPFKVAIRPLIRPREKY